MVISITDSRQQSLDAEVDTIFTNSTGEKHVGDPRPRR